MGAKTFPIFEIGSFKVSGSVGILLIPFIYSINDIFFDVYGQKRTKGLARSSLIIIAMLTVLSIIAVSLPSSSRFQPLSASYNAIFSQTIRISLASLTAFGLANFLDIAVFAKLKLRFYKQGLWFRNNLSNLISLFVDTVVFMTLAFYALDQSFNANFNFLMGLILPYWILKFIVSSFGTPLVYLGVKWLKGEDKIDGK